MVQGVGFGLHFFATFPFAAGCVDCAAAHVRGELSRFCIFLLNGPGLYDSLGSSISGVLLLPILHFRQPWRVQEEETASSL